MTVKISQENGKAVVSVDGNEALKADAAGNVEVVNELSVSGDVTVNNPTASSTCFNVVNGLNDAASASCLRLDTSTGESKVEWTRTGVFSLQVRDDAYFRVQNGLTKIGLNSSTIPSSAIPAGGVALPDVYAAGNVEVVGDLVADSVDTGDVNGLWVGLGGGDVASNVAVGLSSLEDNTTGSSNTALGKSALLRNITGRGNTAVGSAAGANCIGSFNTFVGLTAGSDVEGFRNTLLGSFTGNGSGIDITASNNNIAISDGGGKVSFFKDSSDNVHLRTGNENRLTVQPSGNVSIANDLEVNGTTIAALIARIEALEAGN